MSERPTQIPKEFQGIMSYNPWHDIQDFRQIKNRQDQIQIENRIKKQLEKTLGERFRVRSSQIEYFIENGKLKSKDYPNPVLEQYKLGQEFLKSQGSTETEREAAEIEGLEKIEELFISGKIKSGQKIVAISSRGKRKDSLYKDNIFFVYESNDKKIIETRYHSTHSLEGFQKAAREADKNFPAVNPQNLNDAHFLKNPIITNMDTETILKTFNLDLETQTERQNQEIVDICNPIILSYIKTLAQNPKDIEKKAKENINSIYALADETNKIQKSKSQNKTLINPVGRFTSIDDAILYYAYQPIQEIPWGCPGGQKGFDLSQPQWLQNLARAIGSQRVIDFAPFSHKIEITTERTLCCTCPFCRKKVEATISNGKIACPNCHKEATYSN